PGAVVYHWTLDSRLDITGPEHTGPCARPFVEFTIDCYGNVKLCCFDWQGLGSLGNVYTHGLDELVKKWQQIRRDICGEKMTDGAPAVCRTCRKRHAAVLPMLGKEAWLPEIVEDAVRYVEAVRSGGEPTEWCDHHRDRCDLVAEPEEVTVETGPVALAVAVVLVAYRKVPDQRIQDHFRWNDDVYRKAGARVYVVTDREHDLPSYAECVIYPEDKLPVVGGKRRFSLCATKNAGIKKALAELGCTTHVLICTDVDMMFPPPTWDRMVGASNGEAVIPVYLMVPSAAMPVSGHLDQGCTGTVAMTAANWEKIQWDERCVGYGADDGVLLRDIKAAGVKINRNCTVCHVEHPGGNNELNVPGRGRAGCYGRDEFNWDNFEENRKVLRR
ncbi:MAG: SPASM domain-containing protein, partial [Gemmatimonadetes bacterium]|nr:SPASM domain-containing protein [Gemmatimonadota bacterium]